MERLQKYLARAGLASRRQAEELISAGQVKVNGITVTEMGTKIDPLQDVVSIRGKTILGEEEKVYYLLYKPRGVVTTVSDPQGRRKVTDFLKGIKMRVYPVGRLDYDTEGLLLITNDGELAYRLTHPRYKVDKTYVAFVAGKISEKNVQKLRNGVLLEDGPTLPARVRILERKSSGTALELIIREGRNRQVRRMCDAIGHPVISLKRTGFGPLKLDGLGEGQYRLLDMDEITSLKKAVKQ